MVSKEDVVAAYRLLFGREPENDDVVTHYATEVADRRALRQLFINSAEFRASYESLQGPRPPRAPFSGPPIEVQLEGTPDELTALFTKVKQQWQHLGETEPHWSVLTNDSYFQNVFHMNRDAFYQSGVSETDTFMQTLKRARIERASLRRCVELGCGVGRVTAGLATKFDEVVGIDISAAHLRLAEEYVRTTDITNISFRQLTSIEAVPQIGEFDVLYSRIVLQHNPPPVMARLVGDLLSQLNPGGIAYFQLPTYKAGYRFRIADYLQDQNNTDMEMHYFPQAALLDLIRERGCRILELREDDSIGLSVSAISNTLLVQKVN
ncbi:MAG TPA: methyltransferase domain-containing protein [Telluria sp.]|nr:methyltransferase domain-containing protein [Telluria sp.]